LGNIEGRKFGLPSQKNQRFSSGQGIDKGEEVKNQGKKKPAITTTKNRKEYTKGKYTKGKR